VVRPGEGAPVSGQANAEIARRILAAISEGDAESFIELLDPEVEVHTQRGVRRGRDEVARWARSKFDHLERRYEVDEVHESGDMVVVLARVQYVWRESRKLGDEMLVGIVLDFRDGKLLRWRLYDDPMEAHEELET
jgi:ketosteroid isomerase-like protein